MILDNTRKFKQSSKTQPAPNKQIPFFAKQKFTVKLNRVLETIEIHREEMVREVQKPHESVPPQAGGLLQIFDMPAWNPIIDTL